MKLKMWRNRSWHHNMKLKMWRHVISQHWTTRTPLRQNEDELRCSGRVSSSCSTSFGICYYMCGI